MSLKIIVNNRVNNVPDNYNKKIRALVVDDDPTARDIAIGLMRKLGVATDGIADGNLLEEACSHKDYDLILMDIDMPGRNGFDTAKAAREKQLISGSARIIALSSAINSTEQVKRCLASGMNDCLMKPIQGQILYSRLVKWFPADKKSAHDKKIEDAEVANDSATGTSHEGVAKD